MKRLFYHILIAGITLIISLSSCKDYLNYDYLFRDTLLLDSVFLNKDYTEEWLANVYATLSDGNNVMVASKGHHHFNFIADDMYYGDRLNRNGSGVDSYAWFKNCQYNEDHQQDSWKVNYRAIRDASIFIHNVDRNPEMTPEEILDNKGQARFLRAYFYWQLMRKYGPIPILPDEGLDYTLEYDELAVARSSYEECAEFIASEMALAAQEMTDIPRDNLNIARATPGAALAIRARAYLYAASPLFNGNQDAWAKQLVNDKGEPLLNLEYKEELWAKAAAAAKEVMLLGDQGVYKLHTVKFREEAVGTGYPKTVKPPHHDEYSDKAFPEGWVDIDPFESYRELFNGALSADANKELIFSRVSNMNSEGILPMVIHQMPRSLNGWNCHGVTMKHANTYYMANGEDYYAYGKDDPRQGRPTYDYTQTDDEEPFLKKDVSLDFAGREPRYYASIAFNGSYWETLDVESTSDKLTEEQRQVFYYQGTQDGIVSGLPDRYLLTGIGIKKFIHPRDYMKTTSEYYGPGKIDVDIRYAEILLIYAEAINELTGSYTIPDYKGEGIITVSRDINEMRRGIKPIRMRGGVPDFTANIYGNVDSFRKALKRERQIELFAECHRYFDLRRWKDAPKEETDEVWGYNPNMTKNQRDLFHTPMKISSLPAIFIDKMYLWPIGRTELKRNPKLTQNPGWRYWD